jgi:hypothetical protein
MMVVARYGQRIGVREIADSVNNLVETFVDEVISEEDDRGAHRHLAPDA